MEQPDIYDIVLNGKQFESRPHGLLQTNIDELNESPESHRSQDSGYSDVDHSSSQHELHTSPVPDDDVNNHCTDSPVSQNSIDVKTPPTVIRNPSVKLHLCNARRLSFNDSQENNQCNETDKNEMNNNDINSSTDCNYKTPNSSLRRNRPVIKKSAADKVLLRSTGDVLEKEDRESYDARIGATNTTSISMEPSQTSTPKKDNAQEQSFSSLNNKLDSSLNWESCKYTEYNNPLLNGHPAYIKFWLEEMKFLYSHEPLSTLQSKSIFSEVVKRCGISSCTAHYHIQQVQIFAGELEILFDGVVCEINCYQEAQHHQKLSRMVIHLMNSIKNTFGIVIQNHVKTDKKSGKYFKRINNHNKVILGLASELRIVVRNLEEISAEVLLDDINVLKEYVRELFDFIYAALLDLVTDKISNSQQDLIVRANLNTLIQLAEDRQNGFSDLQRMICLNETVRCLVQFIKNNSNPLRVLALRSLSSICSSKSAIDQLERNKGLPVLLKLLNDFQGDMNRLEIRETVSVLTQITAPWNGNEYVLRELSQYMEAFIKTMGGRCWNKSSYVLDILIKKIELIVLDILVVTKCEQTILLIAACLNNFVRLENTAIYSLMAHEMFGRLSTAYGMCHSRFLLFISVSMARVAFSI